MSLHHLRSRFRRARRSIAARIAASFWGVAASARALPDAAPATTAPDAACMIGPDGLVGGRDVGSARVSSRSLRGALGLGYGYTESVLGEGDHHHRAELELGLAGVVAPWLQLSAAWHGRRDTHSGIERDSGFASGLRLRSRHRIYSAGPAAFALAATLDFPPAHGFATSVTSVSFEGAAIGSVWLSKHTDLAATVGYRVERSAHALPDAERLSPADRLASSASDADALLTGISLTHAAGATRGMLEWSWDALVGSDYRASDGPMRLRFALQSDVTTRLTPGIEFSVRPIRAPDLNTLVRVEPRFWARATLAVALDQAPPPAPRVSRALSPKAVPIDTDSAVTSELQGAVRAEGARAIVASVDVLELNETVHTDAHGRFSLHVRPGSYTLRISATGYESEVRHARVDAQGVTILVIELRRAR